ncbi:MAG: hypothetical protein WAU02_01635 [Candidatus Saccharimonadales bacterium]
MEPQNQPSPTQPSQPQPYTGPTPIAQPAPSPMPMQQPAQPQPTPQPFPQQTPIGPQPGFNSSPMPSPASPSSKKLPLIIGAVVGVVALVGVVLYLTMFSGPSKQDYQQAKTYMEDIHTKYSKLGSEVSNLMDVSGSSSSTAGPETVQTALMDYQAATMKIKSSKVYRDGDVKKAYDTFMNKNDKFIAFMDQFIDSTDALTTTSNECSRVDTSTLSKSTPDTMLQYYDESVSGCTDSLKTLAKVPNAQMAAFGASMSTHYADLRAVVADMVTAAKAKNATGLSSAQSKFGTVLSDIRTTSQKFQTDLGKAMDEIDVKDAANDLIDVLNKKAA